MPVIQTLPDELNAEQKHTAIHFIFDHSDVFSKVSKGEFDVGHCDLVYHRIHTGDAKPIAKGLRRHPTAHLDIVDQHVDKMIEAGLTEEAASPWAANIVGVTKSDKMARIKVDYRCLNDVTYKEKFPIPRVSDCLD
jgi:hypothetical protein